MASQTHQKVARAGPLLLGFMDGLTNATPSKAQDHDRQNGRGPAKAEGYPYGYSAVDVTTPEPVFLKRSIASNRTASAGQTLLDGGATPGMSGAPIILKHQDRWWLLGVYTGVIFPDHQYGPQGPDNDESAALGLMTPLSVARAFMQVPGIYDKEE